MTKRAFIDVTPELLAQLLHLKEDIQVVSVVTRREHGDAMRLHLRGNGLPERTHCMEGEFGECGHWLDDIAEILAIPAAATCVEPEEVQCAGAPIPDNVRQCAMECAAAVKQPNESIAIEAWVEKRQPNPITGSPVRRSERVTIRLNVDDFERAIEQFKLSTSSKFFASHKPKPDASLSLGGIDPAEERRKMEREFHERTCRSAHTASTLWEEE